MYFKVNSVQKKDVLHSTNESLENRWAVVAPQYLTEVIGQNFTWAKYLDNEARMYERTRPYPGYDSIVGRPVMVKVLKYTEDEVLNPELVKKKRRVLEEQINILNTLATPLLPEPLDWFQVSNTVDGFTDKEISETEPVLVLDYIPGETLKSAYKRNQFSRIAVEELEDGNKNYKDAGINVAKICMFISRNIDFLRVLDKKGYMFLGLNPEHILVLKNEIPRFLGLGRICKTKNGKFDPEHINFGRMIRGYSAPELNKVETNFGRNADALAAGIYSIGVIMAQMIYGDFEIYEDTLSSGSISYPNERYRERVLNAVPQKGFALDKLITRLCDPDPEKRLKDLDKIDSILREIGGITLNDEKGKVDMSKNKKNNKGFEVQNSESLIPKSKQTTISDAYVESFDRDECVGIVRDIKTGEAIRITSELLKSSNLTFLVVNNMVRVTCDHMDNGYKLVKRVGLVLDEKKQPIKYKPVSSENKDVKGGTNVGTNGGSKCAGTNNGTKTGTNGGSKCAGTNNGTKTGANSGSKCAGTNNGTKTGTNGGKGTGTNNGTKTGTNGGSKGGQNVGSRTTGPKGGTNGGQTIGAKDMWDVLSTGGKEDPKDAVAVSRGSNNGVIIDEDRLGEVGLDVVGKILVKKVTGGVSDKLFKLGGYLIKTGEKMISDSEKRMDEVNERKNKRK